MGQHIVFLFLRFCTFFKNFHVRLGKKRIFLVFTRVQLVVVQLGLIHMGVDPSSLFAVVMDFEEGGECEADWNSQLKAAWISTAVHW